MMKRLWKEKHSQYRMLEEQYVKFPLGHIAVFQNVPTLCNALFLTVSELTISARNM